MKYSFIILLLICFSLTDTCGQSRMTTDSIFYSGWHQFRYKGLNYDSPRALKKALNLDQNSDLYTSARQYTRTRRLATILEIVGIGATAGSFDNVWEGGNQVRPVPLLIGLASVSTSLFLWKKSRRQISDFVDEYNHAVHDRYIQERFVNPNMNPASQINVGMRIRF